MSNIKEIDLSYSQGEFVKSTERHTAFVAGYGAGKTFVGACKLVWLKVKYPTVPMAYYMPTYDMIATTGIPRVVEFLELFGIPYTVNKQSKTIYLGDDENNKIIFRSMMNPERIVAYEVGYSLIDEADILPKFNARAAFEKILARNRFRMPDGSDNMVDFVSTPEGFKFLHEFFVKEERPNRRIVQGWTADNAHNLPENYIDSLSDIYTPEQLKAYLRGEFVNLTSGTVYHEFNRKKNKSDYVMKGHETLHVGLDFNITKMAAVINVVVGDIAHAIDEIFNAFDTDEVCSILKSRYPNRNIIIYPDSAGGARNTSGVSDHLLLRQNGFTVISQKKNPFIRNRVNAVNFALRDKYFINFEKCPNLLSTLEHLAYSESGEPDKKSGLDHISDAMGYFIYTYFNAKPSFTGGRLVV